MQIPSFLQSTSYSRQTDGITSPQLIIGPFLSGSPLHHHTAAYNYLAIGTKRWLLLPPHQQTFSNRPAHMLFRDVDHVHNLEGVGHFCRQMEGDVLFVPDGWTHATINVETSYGIAEEMSWIKATKWRFL